MKRKRLVVRVVAAIGGTCAIAFLNTPPGYIRDQFVIHPLDMGGVLIAIAAVLFILLLLGQMVVSWATRGDRTLRREGVVSCMISESCSRRSLRRQSGDESIAVLRRLQKGFVVASVAFGIFVAPFAFYIASKASTKLWWQLVRGLRDR
ncbi:MAG: hypothetical protein ACJ74H_04430 [Thermoanaerobaculia bacterium]